MGHACEGAEDGMAVVELGVELSARLQLVFGRELARIAKRPEPLHGEVFAMALQAHFAA